MWIAGCRQDVLYKDYTSNPIPRVHFFDWILFSVDYAMRLLSRKNRWSGFFGICMHNLCGVVKVAGELKNVRTTSQNTCCLFSYSVCKWKITSSVLCTSAHYPVLGWASSREASNGFVIALQLLILRTGPVSLLAYPHGGRLRVMLRVRYPALCVLSSLCAALLWMPRASAFPTGAPVKACGTLSPIHICVHVGLASHFFEEPPY